MTYFVYSIVFLVTATHAAAATPAEVVAGYSRTCYEQLGTQISLSLSQAYHAATPGSAEEKRAKKQLDHFNQTIADFPAFETACNLELDGDQKFICYLEGYASETKRQIKNFSSASQAAAIPECVYLKASGGEK